MPAAEAARKVVVIGIGPGNPDQVTVEAVKALNAAQVLFIPDKGADKQALRQQREAICRRHITAGTPRVVAFAVPEREDGPDGYRTGVAAWHARIADLYATLLRDELRPGETGAFLVWGDPSLYDSTLRILDRARARGAVPFDLAVIPGITSVQALAARHAVPLNAVGEPVLITTGRKLAEGFPEGVASAVVMLDGEQAFLHLDRDDLDIAWGGNLGLDDETLVAGPLPDVAAAIAESRAKVRQGRGWVMDTYLLRRRPES